MPNYRKKLIEVNIPLQAINVESAKDASLTHGHPSTLHRYWARRPLAACRAVIFASMVDDPSECKDEFPTEPEQNAERNRLHNLMKRLVIWQNSNDENLLAEARYEIAFSVARNNGENLSVFREKFKNDPNAVLQYLNDHCPAVYDPFCGGGSIPLEAQRLGLRARASDLNPLPVLLNKAMIELPPQFHNQKPVNPDADPLGMFTGTGRKRTRVPWKGTAGLADDIRYYGAWMREEAYKRIGHLYPKAELPDGTAATVVAWLWARTVPCINPACGLQMPLMKTFQLSKKKGNEHWVKPVVDRKSNTISWVVQTNDEGVPGPTVHRTGAHCCGCGTSVKLPYVREQGQAGNIGGIMTAIVAEGTRKKLFLSPTEKHLQTAGFPTPKWRPKEEIINTPKVSALVYSMTHWHELFTARQLTALTTFSDLLSEVHKQITEDGATEEYACAVRTYLSLAIGRTIDANSSFTRWHNSGEKIEAVFSRQAIPMLWDFPEANPFSTSIQNWEAQIDWVAKVVENLPTSTNGGEIYQADATTTTHAVDNPLIVTDPPYYDNIQYAELSDFFYVWLRPLLRDIYPELFAGMMTPRDEEIVAAPRFENPAQHFEKLLGKALVRMRQHCSDKFPSSIFYAYKQQENEQNGKASTGWETMLMAIINAGFQVAATWPLRTERTTGLKGDKNALTSSIVLVCHPRSETAPTVTRPEFLQALKKEMPRALERLTRVANIRPVDLAQAAIGPGMEIYSRYSKVVRISGEVVPIREVLTHINNEITAYHEKETGELDPETQFCLTWLQQHGYTEGNFGDADVLSKARDVDTATMHNKVLLRDRGKVRLLRPEEYADRENSEDMTAWEGCLRMVWHLSSEERSGGVSGCTAVARAMRDYESAKRLARVLYAYYDARGDAESAARYNNLVTQWQYISQSMGSPEQRELDL
ncbi:DUF1156 domain-containing protein [Candidatus Poribacteria bacterium]|nr:DUF1156 domain-containing protein [Candidatus Poribacteria bacterium]MYK17052.1 DUF1156 domain-containing protein [Candidatus Poribacteria bacterium]